MTVIYLASPIDQAAAPGETDRGEPIDIPLDLVGWDRWGFYKNQAKTRLVELGYEVYDPALAWATSRTDPAAIQQINDEALNRCEGILGFIPDGIPTIGTPIELVVAAVSGRPAVCLGGDAAMRSPVLASRGVECGPIVAWDEGVNRLHAMVVEARDVETEARRVWSTYVSEVLTELVRAANKFPDNTPNNTPSDWFGIVMEEYVEVAQAWNDHRRDPAHHGAEGLRTELVQAGAMSARLYDSIRYID